MSNYYLCDYCLLRNDGKPAFDVKLSVDEVRCAAFGLTRKRVMCDEIYDPTEACHHFKMRKEGFDG